MQDTGDTGSSKNIPLSNLGELLWSLNPACGDFVAVPPLTRKFLPFTVQETAICLQCRRPGFHPRVGEILRRRKWQPTPVLLPGESRGQRSLVGCSPGGCRVRHDWVTSLRPPYHNCYHSLIWITVDVDGCLLELREDHGGWSLAYKEQSESEVAQSRPTLCDPMDCNLPGSSVNRILQARILGVGCHFLPQGIFPTQGPNPGLPHCGQTFYRLSHQGSQRNKKGTKKPPRPGVPWGLAQHPKSVSSAFASLFVALGNPERSSSVLRLLHRFPITAHSPMLTANFC